MGLASSNLIYTLTIVDSLQVGNTRNWESPIFGCDVSYWKSVYKHGLKYKMIEYKVIKYKVIERKVASIKYQKVMDFLA